jgi:hypothetical protein
MTSSSNSTGAQRNPSWTPTTPTIHRRWSALSTAEQGQDAAAALAEQAIEEEIDEIKRYEVWLPVPAITIALRLMWQSIGLYHYRYRFPAQAASPSIANFKTDSGK